MTVTVFDLDKTLINGDSNELWHEFLKEKGILDDGFIQEDKRLMGLYAVGELDMDEYLKFALLALKALSLKEIDSFMSEFIETKIAPIIYKEAPAVIKVAKNPLIISATPEFIVRRIGKFLGIDEAIGMRLVEENGYFTNKYEKPLSYQEGKVACLKNWLKEKNMSPEKIIFYTDSINDLPLCEFAHEAYCVNPDAKLENIAKHKNWKIYHWG